MKAGTPLSHTLLLFGALALAAPAMAQNRSHAVHGGEHRIIHQDGDRRLEIRSRGGVEFNDERDWVLSVPAGGMLLVEERDGGTTRRLEFRPGGRGPNVRFWVNGGERPLDAAGRAWAQRLIRRAVREGGLGAERRVARIRARGGLDGVLAEIAEIESDVARRIYYRALLSSGPLSGPEFARVMDDVARRMRSDVETRLVLMEAVERAGDGRRMAAVLQAARRIDSDVETRLVLRRVAEHGRLADASTREAFFDVVDGIHSDVERRLVLNAAAGHGVADGPSRDAFFRAVGAMRSDVERRLVLANVLRGDAPEATVVAALASAAEMRSDVEKRLVLSAVPGARLGSPRVAAAYRRVIDAMRSDTERRIALRRLADGGR